MEMHPSMDKEKAMPMATDTAKDMAKDMAKSEDEDFGGCTRNTKKNLPPSRRPRAGGCHSLHPRLAYDICNPDPKHEAPK